MSRLEGALDQTQSDSREREGRKAGQNSALYAEGGGKKGASE